MESLFALVRMRVRVGRYVVGQHAAERLEERDILEWQVVDGIESGELEIERLNATPNPVVEVRQVLADGTEITVVWSYIKSVDVAKMVTVHFFDE